MSKILLNIADAMEANTERLATVMSMNNEKSIRETSALDVSLAMDYFCYFAGVICSEEDSASVLDGDMLSIVLREPTSVVGMICPGTFRS